MLAVFTKPAGAVNCACGEIDPLRVGFDGNPIGAPFAIAPSLSLQTQPAVAFDGANFLVVWNELADPPLAGSPKPSRVVAALVTEGGAPAQSFVIADASVVRPVVVWDGTRYFIFYSDPSMQASGVTVSAQGVIGTPFRIGKDDMVTGAAASPSEVVVTMMRADKAELSTIDASLHVSTPVVLASGAREARVAWNGHTFLAAWMAGENIEARSLDNIYERHLIVNDPYASDLVLTASGPLFLAAWDDGAISTAWISVDSFSVAASIDRSSAQFTIAPRYPVVTNVPGRGVAMFYRRVISATQFFIVSNDYVSFVTPPRQRVTRR